ASSLYCSRPHRDLHSFPTRRSSDLFTMTSFNRSQSAVVVSSSGFEIARPAQLTIMSTPPKARQTFAMASRTELSLVTSTTDPARSEEHTSELQSRENLVCRLLLEKK